MSWPSDRPSTVPGFGEPSITVLRSEEMHISQLDDHVYCIECFARLTASFFARAMEAIWSATLWRQPWGLVIVLPADVTYDGDIRQTAIPPNSRRAVGTGIVTPNDVHRMVINSIGVGYRTFSGFALSGHKSTAEAIAVQRRLVRQAMASKRPY